MLSGIRKNIVVEPLLNQTYIQRNKIYIQRISSICLNKPVYSKWFFFKLLTCKYIIKKHQWGKHQYSIVNIKCMLKLQQQKTIKKLKQTLTARYSITLVNLVLSGSVKHPDTWDVSVVVINDMYLFITDADINSFTFHTK